MGKFRSYKEMLDYFGGDPSDEEWDSEPMRVHQEASEAEESVIEEFNREVGAPPQEPGNLPF